VKIEHGVVYGIAGTMYVCARVCVCMHVWCCVFGGGGTKLLYNTYMYTLSTDNDDKSFLLHKNILNF